MWSYRESRRPNAAARFLLGSITWIHGERARWLPVILLLGVSLASCAHLPDINEDCESYGVVESGRPMGQKVHAQPLTRADLDRICGAARAQYAGVQTGTMVNGCAIPQPDGSVLAYYRDGDRCAMNHELCHALHGTGHTERYLEDLSAGIPMPYCPGIQLAGLNRR